MEILELKKVVTKIRNFSKSLDTLRRWFVNWKIGLKKITRLKYEKKEEETYWLKGGERSK